MLSIPCGIAQKVEWHLTIKDAYTMPVIEDKKRKIQVNAFQAMLCSRNICKAFGSCTQKMQWKRAVLCLDDIIVFSKDLPTHLGRVPES